MKIWSKSPIFFCILIRKFYEKDCTNTLSTLLSSRSSSYLVETRTQIGIRSNMSGSLSRSEKERGVLRHNYG